MQKRIVELLETCQIEQVTGRLRFITTITITTDAL